jgi:hypothetical protein
MFSLKNLIPWRDFNPGLSWGGCDVHCAASPGHDNRSLLHICLWGVQMFFGLASLTSKKKVLYSRAYNSMISETFRNHFWPHWRRFDFFSQFVSVSDVTRRIAVPFRVGATVAGRDRVSRLVLLDLFRDRFYETPFRPKTFPLNFQPQILDKFPPESNIHNF